MAQVTKAKHNEIDRLLDLSTVSWEELSEITKEIDTWDSDSLQAYLAEWPLEEDRLTRLAHHAESGYMDENQIRRYHRLVELSNESRPLLSCLGYPMKDDSAKKRIVPALYWFADESNNTILFVVGEADRSYDLFPFFTSEERAQRHRDQSTMRSKWILNSSRDADELIELCENKAHYDAFIFDPIALEGSHGQPLVLSEVKEIIEDNVDRDSWDIGF